MKAAISVISVALSVTILLFSSYNYNFALGQVQQQFQNYQNPASGISIQYPSDWELQEVSNDKLRFIKQEGFVTADLNVDEIDQSDTTLRDYTNTRINELRTQRPSFQLLSSEPIVISNDMPAQKVVYTFEREEDGKTNKVVRIWSINEGKLYTLAYIAESSQYDRYLPAFQRMVDSFNIDAGGSSDTQARSSDRSREDSNGNGDCDRISYPDPDICIPPYPPDLNCPDVTYKDFRVAGTDPHGFDRDKDGIGCESANGGGTPPPIPPPDCDRISYPDVCIPPFPPDLNCGDVSHKNFRVAGSDPHGFDRDNDGIGCESANGGVEPPANGDGDCDPSYPTVCIKSPPPDLNCDDISHKNFKVTGGDPHGFDRDNDGIGCESANAPPIPPPNLPICDENTPPETPCIDEGDPDDPPICTPDGPPCPPCPEGVEAGWCADEDEREDFDCGDPDMENDPRCENGEPVNGSEEEGEGETTEELEEEEEGSQPEGSEGSTGEGETGAESPA